MYYVDHLQDALTADHTPNMDAMKVANRVKAWFKERGTTWEVRKIDEEERERQEAMSEGGGDGDDHDVGNTVPNNENAVAQASKDAGTAQEEELDGGEGDEAERDELDEENEVAAAATPRPTVAGGSTKNTTAAGKVVEERASGKEVQTAGEAGGIRMGAVWDAKDVRRPYEAPMVRAWFFFLFLVLILVFAGPGRPLRSLQAEEDIVRGAEEHARLRGVHSEPRQVRAPGIGEDGRG